MKTAGGTTDTLAGDLVVGALFLLVLFALTGASCSVGNKWGYQTGTSDGFKAGCWQTDPTRIVATIDGKQRCLTKEQAQAVKP